MVEGVACVDGLPGSQRRRNVCDDQHSETAAKGDGARQTKRTRVRPSGFEPETCGLRVRCSAVELEARGESMARALSGRRRAEVDGGPQRCSSMAFDWKKFWGDRGDLNPRPPGPQPGALTC